MHTRARNAKLLSTVFAVAVQLLRWISVQLYCNVYFVAPHNQQNLCTVHPTCLGRCWVRSYCDTGVHGVTKRPTPRIPRNSSVVASAPKNHLLFPWKWGVQVTKKKKKDGGTITANYENQSHLNADFGLCDTHTDSAMPRCASILPLPRPFYSIWSSLLTRSPTRTRSVPLFGSCEHTRNSSGQDGRRSFLFARRRSSSWWILFTSLCETSTRELTHSTEAIDAHCPDRPKKKKVSFFLTFFC